MEDYLKNAMKYCEHISKDIARCKKKDCINYNCVLKDENF